MRRNNSARATVLQIVHCIFVAREAIKQVKIDNGEFIGGKNPSDHSLAVFQIAGEQVDDLTMRDNCLVQVFNMPYGRNDGSFAEEHP